MVINATPKIIKALIDKAKEGSYLHARMLFELAGVTGISEPSERESPLVAILIKELGLTIPPNPEGSRDDTGRASRELPSTGSSVAQRGLSLQSPAGDEPSRRDANKTT